jgi:hypothetical protein
MRLLKRKKTNVNSIKPYPKQQAMAVIHVLEQLVI